MEVQFSKRLEAVELISLKLFDAIAFEVKDLEADEAVKSMILNTRDQRMVEVEGFEIFTPDESMTF